MDVISRVWGPILRATNHHTYSSTFFSHVLTSDQHTIRSAEVSCLVQASSCGRGRPAIPTLPPASCVETCIRQSFNECLCLSLSRPAATRGPRPTIDLQRALDSFEEILSADQKQEYHASGDAPDVASVITFIKQLDISNGSPGRRYVAPRLCTFLQATQQFSGVVDTFVSSHPQTSALIWGGVKTALLAANNVASYFDKVTGMILEIGKMCPTYQQFGQLYPGCVNLQRAICNYYALIIQLCIKIIEVSRRSTVEQTLSSIFSPFESEFNPHLDQLGQAGRDIQLQITLAAQKSSEHEIQENSGFRSKALSIFTTVTKQQAETHKWQLDKKKMRDSAKLRFRIREYLSKIDHVKPWKQAFSKRVSDTAEWLQQEVAYREWKNDQRSAILWCSGTIGVGKTVLMSNVVAQLHTSRDPNDVIAYYFCRSDHEESLSAINILGSLARQLDSQIEQAGYDDLIALHEHSQELGTPDVAMFLLSRLEPGKRYYLIFDGLDECHQRAIREVAQSITQLCLQETMHVKVLCAGRPELEQQLFKDTEPQYKISVTETKVESDMLLYIDETLKARLRDDYLKLGDRSLVPEISKALQDGSNGMFLWTYLLIEELCAQHSDNAILEALKHLPRGLAELFDRKLRRIREQQGAAQVIKLLQFCGVAKRPLTLAQYQELLSLSPEQISLDPRNFPNDMHRLISDCRGLTFVEEEEETAHYVHSSVKQHLFTSNGPRPAEFDMPSLDQCLGFLCMTYLTFANPNRKMIEVNKSTDMRVKPIHLGIQPILQSSGISPYLAQQLLSGYDQLQQPMSRDVEVMAQNMREGAGSPVPDQPGRREFQFLLYAKHVWYRHLVDLVPEEGGKVWSLFCQFIAKREVPADRPWISVQQGRDDESDLLRWSLGHGHSAIILYLGINQPDVFTKPVTKEITSRNHHHLTKMFGQLKDLRDDTIEILNRALVHAAGCGCSDYVAILLKSGADVNVEIFGQRALESAARGGHLQTTETLIAAGAGVDAGPPTALISAARKGYLAVLDCLINAGANVNAKLSFGTALTEAAKAGHLEVVERLIAADADVNAKDSDQTALMLAAAGGHRDVVGRLISAGANVNAQTCKGTALILAAEGGHPEVVEKLIAANADVNVQRSGRTALMLAAANGRFRVVESLIAAGANVSACPRIMARG